MSSKLKTKLPLCAIAAVSVFAFQASGQVNLTAISPATAQPLVTLVSVTGSNFPAGTIAPGGVTVTLTPSAGNGGPVTTPSTSVTTVLGSTRKVTFRVPSSLASASPFTATIAISGATDSGNTFTGTGNSVLTILPPAAIENVSPGAVTRGTTQTLTITGRYSHFLSGSSTISAGAGTLCSVSAVTTPTSLTASCIFDSQAAPGLRDIVVTTPGSPPEIASSLQSFLISAGPALSFTSFNPASALQGETKDILVTGLNTHFIQGTTVANFSQGVKINSVTVTSETTAKVNITVDPLTFSGYRTVTLATLGEFALSNQTFFIGPSPASLSSISQTSAVQGQTLSATITGIGTHFAANASTVSFGLLNGHATVTTGSVQVTDDHTLTVDMTVLPDSPIGTVPITVATGGEFVTLSNAFTIGAATPVISSISPSTGMQGQTLSVTITGAFTDFQPTDTADFGSGITVNSVTRVNAKTLIANISIASLAANGSRAGRVRSQNTDLLFTFSVQPSNASLSSATPASGQQGTSLTIHVDGVGTHFVQGTTTASIVCCSGSQVTINRITVNPPLSLDLDVTIPPNEPAQPHTFSISTGGEALIVPGGFTVIPATPTLTMSPSSGGQGTSFPVEFTGQFTSFNAGTTLNLSGTGVSVSQFSVTGPNTASAVFTIASNAPLTVFNPYNPRIVTLTTGSQVVTTGFSVTPGHYISSVTPNAGAVGQTLTVSLKGVLTHFVNGQTTMTMGPDITITNVIATSATSATAQVAISNNAVLGWRTAFVNTGNEYATVGFLVKLPFNAALTSVAPTAGDQGQSLTITITGDHTNFKPGITQAIIGAGISVNSLTVLNSNTATAQISISPTAYTGLRTVSMITGTEVVNSQIFAVNPGIAILTGVTPNNGSQGQVVPVNIVGANTHFLQGLTTASVGGGVTVSAFNVTSATTATAQFTVGGSAALGLQTVTLHTAGETAALENGFTVTQGTPVLLSTTPATGNQGTTFNVVLLGQSTHWVQGVTTANFGLGITTNSVTVTDAVTATANITVSPITTTGLRTPSVTTGSETTLLNPVFQINAGAAILTLLNPNSARQGDPATIHITGQNTNFQQGVTTVNAGLNINVGVITVNSTTSADVMLAISPAAATGLRSLTLNTVGESATSLNGFMVNPGIPTLNSASPNTLQQGLSASITVLGQFTNFQQGVTTVTFGQGVAVGAIAVINKTSLTVAVTVDPLAFTGSRSVTVTTNGEIVSGNYFSVTASPAILSSVAPNQGGQGQTLDLIVTGQATHFAQGLTTVALSGLGISINSVIVNSPTVLVANISIANTAPVGVRTLVVSTGGEQLMKAGGFDIDMGIPLILSLSPASAKQGDTNVNVQIAGQFTGWAAGTTVTTNSPDLTVGAVTINNPGSITAVISVSPTAVLGPKTITVSTGGQGLTATFTVNTSATVPSIFYTPGFPSSAIPGQTLTTQFTGLNTHFNPQTTTASFGAGITVNSTQVLSANTVNVNLTIDAAAAIGNRTVTIATGGEVVTSTFGVVNGVPGISSVTPSSIKQGDGNQNIIVTGQFTTFKAGVTTADFGAGITTNSVQVNGPTSATINISVDPLAATGLRPFSMTTVAETVGYGSFLVNPGPAVITSVSPASAKQGETLSVAISGTGTHFAQGVTAANFGSGVTVTSLTITSATTASAALSIAALAATGLHAVTLSTGGENATLATAFTVNPGTPIILSATPTSGQQQMDVTVTVLGQYTGWAPGQTTATLGAGVTVNSVAVNNGTSLQIFAHITALAALGARDVVVTTGGQVLTLANAFAVTAGPAAISSLSPNTGKQGDTNKTITITGVNTNWGVGTTANFGPGITVNSLTVNGAMSATAVITIAANAAPAFQTVTLTTSGEVASIVQGFTIQGATPVLLTLSPVSAQQGQTRDIAVTGAFTSFVAGTTTANFGAGVTVNSVAVQDDKHAVVNVTVQPTAALGARDVALTTNTEVASKAAGFTVQAGSAVLTSVTPPSGRLGQTVPVVITGAGTHFLQGATTGIFGPNSGVTATSLTINSDTSATAVLNIPLQGTVGPIAITLTTGGETATLATAFTVNPALLQITTVTLPNAVTNQPYSQTVALTGGLSPFAFSITSGALPAGLTLHPTSGLISGSPTATGTSTFEVTVTDNSSQTAKQTYTIIDSDALLITTTALDPSINGQAYSQTLVAQGGVTPRVFSILNGTLPAGLTITPAGVIAGAATVNGTANFTVRVTDNIGQIFDKAFSIAVYAPLTFVTTTLPNGRRTVTYSQTVNLTGGIPSVTFSVTTGALPGGLALNSTSGAITGTPNAAGTFNFQITATDSKTNTAIQALAIVVADALSIVSGPALPKGFVGIPYSQTIQTSDGVAPVNFGITNGALPDGLNLLPGTGVISGTPSAAGLFTFTLQATDAANLIASRVFTLQIALPPVILSVAPASGPQGQTLDVTITGQDTNFAAGITSANFGAGVTVNTVSVSSTSVVIVNVTVAVNAAAGARTVTLTTAAEVASKAAGFSVVVGLPVITSMTPPFGKKGATVSVAVAGQNLLGATFALKTVDPSDVSTPATVTLVSNTGTLATLTLVLGPKEGQFPLVATTTLGASAITDAAEFLIAPTINTAGSYLSVLNTKFDPATNPPFPPGRNSASAFFSVLNTSFDPAVNPPFPPGRNKVSTYLSVLNTSYSSAGSTTRVAAGLKISICNRNSGCTASPAAAIVSDASQAVQPGRLHADAIPVLDPVESIESVTAGQTVRLSAQNVEPGSTVEFNVNQAVVALVNEAPYEALFTIPEGMADLVFRIVVRRVGEAERVSKITRMMVAPDNGAAISGRIANGVEHVAMELAAAGLKAEFFQIAEPVTGLPSLAGLTAAHSGYVTAINQPNPRGVFGDDPLGAHLTHDYAVRFAGQVWADAAGDYRFWAMARSGVALTVDGKQVSDTGFVTGDAAGDAVTLTLERGWHDIEVVYYQAVGAASVRLEWQQPGSVHREVLGPEYLRTVLSGVSAVSAEDGTFHFPQVPRRFDSVWIRVRHGKTYTEYPAVKPGADQIQLAVQK